jgi:hypothetical protein
MLLPAQLSTHKYDVAEALGIGGLMYINTDLYEAGAASVHSGMAIVHFNMDRYDS